MKERDVSIELIRIVGSMIVVALHCLCILYSSKSLIFLFKAFLLTGVPLFWIIMGNPLGATGGGYCVLRKYKKAVEKIIFPALLVMIFTELFLEYINSHSTILNVVSNPYIDWNGLIKGIMRWECARDEYAHLWYVFSYVKILICFPVIRYICCEEKEKTYVRRILIVLLVITRLSVEIQHLFFDRTYLIIYAPFSDIAIGYVLIGYEFKHYWKDIKQINKLICLFIYVTANLGIYILNRLDMSINEVENYFHSAGSVGIIISSCMLFAMIKHCSWVNTSKNILYNIVSFAGSKTFGIYLIHYMIIRKIKTLGVVKHLQWNPIFEYVLIFLAVYFI